MIASSLAQINVLLEKTADWDKDERYMATNDLCQLLSKDIKIDESMEAKICTAVLKQLDDAIILFVVDDDLRNSKIRWKGSTS